MLQAENLPQAYGGCPCTCHRVPGVKHIMPCCGPSAGPTRYKVGDKVVITEACIERMWNSNRSCVTPQYPTCGFIEQARACLGVIGEVTHVFPPGYEVTACFGSAAFHMKDNWIEVVNG